MPPKKRVLDTTPSPMDAVPTATSTTAPSPNANKSNLVAPVKKVKHVDLKIKNNYPALWKESQAKDEKHKGELFEQLIDEENRYRELFAQERTHEALQNEHLMLIDVHENTEMFKYAQETPEEQKIPRVFEVKNKKRAPGTNAIVSKEEFQRNFDIFTEGQLKYLNWNNLLVAGGSVLACLTPIEGAHGQNLRTKRNFFHKIGYKSSDIDLFVYGIEDEEQANKKIEEVYNCILEANPKTIIAFRSLHAVTIVSEYPYRHIQIVLRLYKSPAEILMGFDVDCCSVGFDGKKVWMLPRTHRAITYQYNTVDMTRRSPSFEMRLAKYAQRGFSVLVPSLDRSRIDPQLFEKRFDQLQGLARLLLLEKLENPESRSRFKEQQRLRRLRNEVASTSFWRQLAPELDDEFSKDRLQELGGADASDYSTVFLPWGPKWNSEKVRKLMYSKDMVLNSKWYDPTKRIHTHPCFFGTVSEIVQDCCGRCPPIPPELEDPDSPYVAGKMTWVTVNPGAQTRIGSFHPITEGDWTEGAYLSDAAGLIERMCIAVNANDTKALQKCIDEGADVNSRDGLGRTPLMIAAFSNSVDCAKILIKKECRISPRAYDGRTALHIAAAHGNVGVVEVIIERGKKILETSNAMDTSGSEAKKTGKKSKPTKKKGKKKRGDDEDEDEDMEDDEGEDEGGEDEDGDGEDDESFWSIKAIIDRKKKAHEENLAKLDPNFKATDADVDKTFEIDTEDWDMKMSPLRFAALFGHSDVIRVLIDNGAAVNGANDNGKTPILALPLVSNSIDAAKVLLEKGFNINQVDTSRSSALNYAITAKNLSFVKLFVEHKGTETVNLNPQISQTPLLSAIPANPRYDHRRNNFFGRNRFTFQSDPNQEREQKLAEERAKDNLDDRSFAIIKYLISKGAKVQYTEADLPDKQQQLNFNIYLSSGTKRQQLRNFYEQPITKAVELCCPRLVSLFLDNGADVNWINTSNQTPLDIVSNTLRNHKNALENARKTEKEFEEKLNKLDKKSFHYNVLSKQYINNQVQLQMNTAQSTNEISLLNEVFKLLISKGATRFYLLTLSPDDKELKDQQKRIKDQINFQKKQKGNKKVAKKKKDSSDDEDEDEDEDMEDSAPSYHPPTFGGGFGGFSHAKVAPTNEEDSLGVSFSSIGEQIPGSYASNRVYDKADQPKYLELFEAVYSGDIKRVEALTIKKPINSQLHVASCCNTNEYTTLHVAMERNDPNMVVRLLEIAQEQFTPLPAPQKVDKEGKVKPINNYELSRILADIKPGAYLDSSGYSLHQDYQPLIPNQKMIQLNCVTSPASFLKHNVIFSVFHVAAKCNSTSALKALIEHCRTKKILPHPYNNVEKLKYTDFNAFMINTFIWQNSRQGFTPFQTAMVYGNLEVGTLLLENGGLQTPLRPVSEEQEYTGLLVSGKKMDWAKKFHGRLGRIDLSKFPSSMHLAAIHGQSKSIEFLVTKAPSLWSKNIIGDATKTPRDFDLYALNASGETPLMVAIRQNQLETAKKILDLDNKYKTATSPKPLVDITTKKGISCLQIAASLGKVEAVELLINNNANVEHVDNSRGWNALHFAAWGNYKQVAELLVKKNPKLGLEKISDKTDFLGNVQSHKLLQTPLMIAAYYNSEDVLDLLLKSKASDPNIRDAAGNHALYFAIIAANPKCVNLLLQVNSSLYCTENGVGITSMDAAIQKLLLSNDDPEVTEKLAEILDSLRKVLRFRILAPSAEVRKFTESTIQQVREDLEEDEKEVVNKIKSWRSRYDSDDDDSDNEDEDQQPQEAEKERTRFTDTVHSGFLRLRMDSELPPEKFEKKNSNSEEPIDPDLPQYLKPAKQASSTKAEPSDAPDSLKGLTIALTGTLSKTRKEIVQIIESNGGKYATSINAKTTHLICDDPNAATAKLEKAKAQGIKVVGEDFLDKFV